MSIGHGLISKILQDRLLPDFLRLREEYFEGDDEVKVFTYVTGHVDRHRHLPTLELTQGDLRREGVILNPPPTEDVYSVYLERFIRRATHTIIREDLGDDLNDLPPEEAIDAIRNAQEKLNLLRADADSELVQMADLGDLVLEEARIARDRGGMTGIPTGYPSLDLATRGWQPGDFYVMLARPKMGKTLIMLKCADAAHRAGHIPMVVSMEMRKEQMARRHFAMRAGMNMNTLQRGQLSTFGERILSESITEMQGQHPYHFIEGQFNKDIQDLIAVVKSRQPHVIFIDGGYLLKMRRSMARAKWELITDIAQELKSLGSESRAPVIVSFQFTRGVKQKSQTAEFGDIQLSDAIGQLASVAIGIFEARDPDAVTSARRRAMKIIGGREGEGEIEDWEINWDWDRMLFDEIVDEYEEESLEEEGE